MQVGQVFHRLLRIRLVCTVVYLPKQCDCWSLVWIVGLPLLSRYSTYLLTCDRDVYDVVLVLRSQKALDGFKGKANVTLGAERGYLPGCSVFC